MAGCFACFRDDDPHSGDGGETAWAGAALLAPDGAVTTVDVVGAWLRIQPRARPIAVHAAWRTDADTAVAVVMGVARKVRTPEPLRQARRVARLARAGALATTS